MTTQIEITWQAFGNKPEQNRFISSVQFTADFEITDENRDTFLNVVYQQTNTYNGNLWNIIQPLLSPTRTHTSLSIGDAIKINETTYLVADWGFVKEEDADIRKIGNSIFSITEKVGA